MQKNPRGMAVIINNMTFQRSANADNREGSDVDATSLEQLFQKFFFETLVVNDQTADVRSIFRVLYI